jgi:dienelactone hydrolase
VRKEKLIEKLNPYPEVKPDLDPIVLERKDCGEYIRERIEIGTYDDLRMPIYVLIPKRAPRQLPVVLALHGHGYGSRSVAGLSADNQEEEVGTGIHKHFGVALARRGHLVIVPEILGFGDRRLDEDVSLPSKESSCFKLASYLLQMGKTLNGIRAYELTRALDYGLSRAEAAGAKAACMGLSGGAHLAYLTALLDDRIEAVVLSGYTNTFEHSLLAKQHCLDDYIPGIMELGEMADIIGLIAPRPLLLEAGRYDRSFPLPGVESAASRLKSIYEELGASDRFGVHIFDGGHEVSGEVSYEWISRQFSGEAGNT